MISIIKKILERRFIRFLLVGGINTLFGYGVFVFFIYIGIHYSLAALLGTILGVLFNFQTIGRLVFANHSNGLILKFVSVYGATYFVNVTGLYFLNMTGMNNYLAGAILLLPMALITFYLNKTYVFRPNNQSVI